LNAITRTVATRQVFIVLDFHIFAFKKAIQKKYIPYNDFFFQVLLYGNLVSKTTVKQ